MGAYSRGSKTFSHTCKFAFFLFLCVELYPRTVQSHCETRCISSTYSSSTNETCVDIPSGFRWVYFEPFKKFMIMEMIVSLVTDAKKVVDKSKQSEI